DGHEDIARVGSGESMPRVGCGYNWAIRYDAGGYTLECQVVCATWATSLTPSAAHTRLIVSKRGCASARKALYSASRVMPDALAISVMPRARATVPSASASAAGSFSSSTTVRYSA